MKRILIIVITLCLVAGCSAPPLASETPSAAPEATASDTPQGKTPETIIPQNESPLPETSAEISNPTELPEELEGASQTPSETPPTETPLSEPAPAETLRTETPPEESASPALDKYQTGPVPEGKPAPAETQDITLGETVFSCTLSVRCDTILDNIGDLDPEKLELVPEDGIIFAAQTVTFYEGESVFNVLQREMKRAKIHMEFRNTPIYNSAYIMGIKNLYEFDCGPLSGWMYKVNDWFPNYGCSRYQLQDGDIIEWIYTCDLGRDVGGEYAISN